MEHRLGVDDRMPSFPGFINGKRISLNFLSALICWDSFVSMKQHICFSECSGKMNNARTVTLGESHDYNEFQRSINHA
jgi:hypothetical protein